MWSRAQQAVVHVAHYILVLINTLPLALRAWWSPNKILAQPAPTDEASRNKGIKGVKKRRRFWGFGEKFNPNDVGIRVYYFLVWIYVLAAKEMCLLLLLALSLFVFGFVVL